MNYYGYNPYGWMNGSQFGVPAYGYGGMGQNPQSVPNQYQAPTQNAADDIPKVHGEEGALTLGYSLGPNRARIAIDETKEDIEWLIVTDSAGFPTLKRWRILDVEDEPKEEPKVQDPPVYVTTKEFDGLKETVDILTEKVESLLRDLGGTSNEQNA